MMSKTFFLDGRMTAHLAWQIFTSREACLTQLADDLGRLLRAAQQEQDMVSLLLPGGSSPAALLPLLAEQELDWRALRISPTDERWVAADAPQSNWRLLYSGLPKAFVLDPRQAEHIEQAAQNWGEQVASWAPFSAVLLGMGEDGHVASLFPPLDDQAACGEAACMSLAAQPPVQRISLQLGLLLRSQWLGLLAFGAAKQRLLQQIQARPQCYAELPITRLLAASDRPLTLYWAP